jgi:hypothetical protein
VREPEGNGVAERFIRTLKEKLELVINLKTSNAFGLAVPRRYSRSPTS